MTAHELRKRLTMEAMSTLLTPTPTSDGIWRAYMHKNSTGELIVVGVIKVKNRRPVAALNAGLNPAFLYKKM